MYLWPSTHPQFIPASNFPDTPLHSLPFIHEPPFKPFPFFRLPTELRFKVLALILLEPHFSSSTSCSRRAIDLGPDNLPRARSRRNLFLANKQLHAEASHLFYSGNTFRILPTHGRFFKIGTKPLIPRLSQRCRDTLTSLELRLGPGWNSPPRSWVVNHKLKLEKCHNVRVLKLFVECDPSQPSFKGFRISETFFTDFASELLKECLNRLPALEVVSFETFPSVEWDGDLMRCLQDEARRAGKRIVHVREEEEMENGPATSGSTKTMTAGEGEKTGDREDGPPPTVRALRHKMMKDSNFIIRASQLRHHQASVAEEVH